MSCRCASLSAQPSAPLTVIISAVQLWHRSNYYWYLKAELAPRLSLAKQLQTVAWHPEKAQEIELIAAGAPFLVLAEAKHADKYPCRRSRAVQLVLGNVCVAAAGAS